VGNTTIVSTLRDASLRDAPQGEVVLDLPAHDAPLEEWRAPSLPLPFDLDLDQVRLA
jgi:hypothetical protein